MIDITEKDLEKLKCPEITLGATTFYIDKLNAMNACDLLDKFRFELAKTDFKNSSGNIGIDIFKSFAAISPDFMIYLRDTLYTKIEFTNNQAAQKTKLTPAAYDIVFSECDAADIYNLTLRCFFINFFSSFQKAKTLFQHLNPLIK